MRLKTKAFVITGALIAASSAWANIVQNGGFESGDLTGWNVNNSAVDPWRIETAGWAGLNPFGGTYFVSTGCVGSQCITGTPGQQASLSQTLSTISGGTYSLNFEFGTSAGTPNELDVLWNGSSVLDLGPGGTLGQVNGYTDYVVSGLVANSSSSTLTFLGRQDPGWNALDNVDVEQTNTVTPEPASYAAMVLVMGSLILVTRLRRAK